MNDGYPYREQLGVEAEGRRLLDHLARRYRHATTAEWRERIESGRVLLDAEPARPTTLLRRGQTLIWRRPPWEEPYAPTSFEVLYADQELLAVSKPAGLPTLPGGGFLQRTLLYCVRARVPDASPLHRLGRWTSGVVLFARTQEGRSKLARQWASREVGKRYRALASGDPAHGTFVVDHPVGRVPHPLLGSVQAASTTGKPASSHVVVVGRRAGCFLGDIRIATGRPHQIRIHLAVAGHPLVGDPLYAAGGLPRPGCCALPGDPGYALHAAELSFRHPSTGRPVTVRCPPPPRLR